MGVFVFEPIHVNANAPGGPCALRTFADVGAFVLNAVDLPRRLSPHWSAARRDLVQARFGARRAEAHQAMREALAVEGWLVGLAMGAGSRRHPITGNLPSVISIIQWRGAIPSLSTSRSGRGLVASTTAGPRSSRKKPPTGGRGRPSSFGAP
jgi:hypothetical protein